MILAPSCNNPRNGRVPVAALCGVALAAALLAGCSRSLGEFDTSRNDGRPISLAPGVTPPAATLAAEGLPPPTALAPETGAPVATLGTDAAALPPSPEQTGSVAGATRKRLLTPEEKARIIAELEALAQRQASR